MFAVSKHVTLWMRQTGSEGRGEAGKCLHNLRIQILKYLTHILLSIEKVKLINI